MNRNSIIWAKSIKVTNSGDEPRVIGLCEHTKHLLDKFEELKVYFPSNLHDPIKVAIFLHDTGKVLPFFQRRRLKNLNYDPFDVEIDIEHSIFSVLLINKDELKRQIQNEDYENFILSAVAFHHWRDKFEDLIRFGSNHFQKFKDKPDDFKQQLIQNLKLEMNCIDGFNPNLIELDKHMLEGLAGGVAFSTYVIPPYQLYFLPQRIDVNEEKKKDWILIAGTLMRCDHFASYCEEDNQDYPIEINNLSFDEIKRSIIDELQTENLWQLKYVENYKDKNTILIAPTGIGKTEFALLWSNGKKMFYTLPIRAAVEQIFERSRKIFNRDQNERVGILHSDADVYLIEDKNEESSIKLYDNARQLAFAVNVSTGDQFFPYALRPPGFEKIYSTFSYSNLVIDEVQAYEPKAAAIVVKYVEDVIRMGGRILLMTATFPKFIQDKIERRLKNLELSSPVILNLFEDNRDKLINLKKHKIQLIKIQNSNSQNNKPVFNFPDELINEIVENGKSKRVLVICNTIRQAQDVYERIKKITNNEIQVDLLHSRFTFDDRKKKQDKLAKDFSNPKKDDDTTGKILIATQVVEAALDIDADILYTELAPMDVLVQRMGRVLRRYRENYVYDGPANVNIIIFSEKYESGNSRVYNTELLELTLALFFVVSCGGVVLSNMDSIIEEYQKLFKDERERSKIINEMIETNPIIGSETNKRGKKSKLTEQALQFSLSEYEKYQLTNSLYFLIDDQSKYKEDFYKTLNLLDAGFMADTKFEAQKIFRPMITTSVISSSRLENLKKDILDFFAKNEGKKRIYTLFKEYIISRYVVNVNGIKERNPLNKIELWLDENFTPDLEISKANLEQLKRWMKNIYITDAFYDENLGLAIKIEEALNTNIV